MTEVSVIEELATANYLGHLGSEIKENLPEVKDVVITLKNGKYFRLVWDKENFECMR